MAMPHASALSQNQLQFCLSTHSRRHNDRLAFTFRKPAPVVIERLPTHGHQNVTQEREKDVTIGGNFSAVSRGRLEEAIFLARRDVQSGRTGTMKDHQSAERPKERMKQRRQKGEGATSVGVCGNVESVTGAARREHKEPTGNVAEKQRGRTMSDVTVWQNAMSTVGRQARDSRVQRSSTGHALSEDEKQAVEIFRLRKQLHEQLLKLKSVRAAKFSQLPAQRRVSSSKSRRTIFDEQADTIDLRAAVKAEEQAARSARMLYVLQRQVHEMQDELERHASRPQKVSHTKKSRSLSQLAAAHRAAIRAIQAFVQTGEKCSYTSLAGMQQELAFLIRQLSQCCNRMNVGGSDVVSEMEDMLSCISTGECKPREEEGHNKKEEAGMSSSRHNDWNKGSYGDSSSQQLSATESDDQLAAGQSISGPRLQISERNGVTKTGMDAKKRMKWHQPHFRWNAKHVGFGNKSVLLPLRSQRVLASRPYVVSGQFADQTVASTMKRKVKGTGREIRQLKTQKKKGKRMRRDLDQVEVSENKEDRGESREEMKFMKQKFQEVMEREAARQSWLDGETLKQVAELNELRRLEKKKLDELRNEMERNQTVDSVSSHPERLVCAQQPMVAVDHVTRDRKETLLSKLSTKAIETALSNADILTEAILDDLLLETAQELSRIDSLAEWDLTAKNVAAAPTLEGMKQRMDAFELTERDIRRRWLHVQFEDEHCEPYKSNPDSRTVADSTIAAVECDFDVFPQQEVRLTACHLNRQIPSVQYEGSYRYNVNLDSVVLQRILLQQQDYSRHLRQTATHPSGNFNPWELVERISEQLLDECLSDVAAEVDGVCDNYVEEQIYSREFVQAQ